MTRQHTRKYFPYKLTESLAPRTSGHFTCRSLWRRVAIGMLVYGLSHSVAAESIRYEKIVRETPRSMVIHVLRIDLSDPEITLDLAMGPKPPPGEAGEVRIADPLDLAREADLCWAINTNPWQHPDNPLTYPSAPGETATIIGWARSEGTTHSATCVGCWEFWLDAEGHAHIGNIDDTPEAMATARLGVGGFQGLVRDGKRLIRESSGQRAPRAAMGLDRDSRILIWVIAEKGVPAGLPGWRDVLDHYELANIMIELDCWNAYNLDGGGSSIMIQRIVPDDGAPQWRAVNTQARHHRRLLPLVLGVRHRPTQPPPQPE